MLSIRHRWINLLLHPLDLPYNASFEGGHGAYTPAFDGYELCNETTAWHVNPGAPCQLDTTLLQELIYPLRFATNLGSTEPAALRPRVAYNNVALYDDFGVIHANAIAYGTGFVVPYLLLGDEERANAHFVSSMDPFVGGPFKSWYEDPGLGGTPNFLTGAGGWLQVLIMGWAGMHWIPGNARNGTNTSILQLTPRLPTNTTVLSVEGIKFIGVRLGLQIQDSHAEVGLLGNDGDRDVTIHCFRPGAITTQSLHLQVGQHVQVALGVALNISVG